LRRCWPFSDAKTGPLVPLRDSTAPAGNAHERGRRADKNRRVKFRRGSEELQHRHAVRLGDETAQRAVTRLSRLRHQVFNDLADSSPRVAARVEWSGGAAAVIRQSSTRVG